MSNLHVGSKDTTTDPVTVYKSPDRSADVLRVLEPDQEYVITNGPHVSEAGETWWQIDNLGWLPEKSGDKNPSDDAPKTGRQHNKKGT